MAVTKASATTPLLLDVLALSFTYIFSHENIPFVTVRDQTRA
jgi:predicted solute-binding protein